ncbi:response regulator transcription factor [Mesorhizobium sp. M0011]|uniref:response regulator transcription factor n=1 Tax=Mesorhizobium sp. M0011 TaxID=2956839 RepID=UPI0033376F22
MQAVILTAIKLLGDSLARCLMDTVDISVVSVTGEISQLNEILASQAVDIILIDMTQNMDLDDVRALAVSAPEVVLIALGLKEQRQDVIRCGRAGFSAYVARDASVEAVAKAMRDAVSGRLACPAEISSGLLRALFRAEVRSVDPDEDAPLTNREGNVLQLIGRGLTNKEIARELNLSVATVKHHVHNVLEKLKLPRRAHAMRRVRERPWIAS